MAFIKSLLSLLWTMTPSLVVGGVIIGIAALLPSPWGMTFVVATIIAMILWLAWVSRDNYRS